MIILTHMAGNLVDARELQVRLGTYLRRVRQGQTLVVTDGGEPIAELRPITAAAEIDVMLAKLEASGAVVRPTRKGLPPFRPIENRGGSVAVAVIEERDEGVTLD